MRLNEMFDAPVAGFADVESDNSKPTWRATRKTKLTLQQIRKLRRMLDVRNYESKLHLDKVRKQYGAKPDDQTGMPGL
jgi:hypothetical protein